MSYFPIVIRLSKMRFLSRSAFQLIETPEQLHQKEAFKVVKTGVDKQTFVTAMEIVFGSSEVKGEL